MNFDLRLPVGLMFTLFGVILVVYGLIAESAIYQKSLGININVIWGAVLLAFGVLMLVLTRSKSGK